MTSRRGGSPISGGGGGDGGSGGSVPTPPAAGLILTSTGSGPTDYDWEPPGGFGILTFSGAQTIEVGDAGHASVVNPAFAATYSETPDSANITNSDGIDSPHVLVTPFTSGTVTGTFGPKANNASTVFTLHATKGSTITRTSTKTWSNPIVFGIANVGDVAATQAFLDALAAQIRQLHTANGGTYAVNPTVGKIAAFAVPSAYVQPPTVFDGSFFVAPLLIGTVAAWDNGRGVTISMNVYTVGAAGIGATSFTLS